MSITERDTASPVVPDPVRISPPAQAAIDPFLSAKFRFYSFLSMVLLVFVHGYNLADRYLQPFTTVNETATFTTFTEYFLANGLFRFRIPMLFVISGYLFAMRDAAPYPARILRRLRTLMAPYLLWSILGLLLTLAFEQSAVFRPAVLEANLQPFGGTPVGSYSINQLLIRIFLAPVPFQLWFIRCLFVYNLLYPLLRRGVRHVPYLTLPFFGLLWTASFFGGFIEGEGLLFFTLGVFLATKGIDPQSRPSWLNVPVFAAVWLLLLTAKTLIALHPAALGSSAPPILYFSYKISVILGLVSMWYGCDWLVRFFMSKQWFVWCAAFSFIIYALHVPLINYLIVALDHLHFAWAGYRLAGFILLPLWVIGVSILLGAALRKTVPSLYGLLTGGRGML